jgi:hypothetical protein
MITPHDRAQAWIEAGEILKIQVVAPFQFRSEDALFDCIAWLPDFGGPRGLALISLNDEGEMRVTLDRAGYFVSALGPDCDVFKQQTFTDALLDWGYFGPAEHRQPWMDAPNPWTSG